MNEVLIDAVYINTSGGLVLLKYFIQEVLSYGAPRLFFLLDERIEHLDLVPSDNVKYVKGKEIERTRFYKENGEKFERVLCFGNIPPTIRLKAKTYTFFQNVILLNLPKQAALLQRPKWLLKRLYIRWQKGNTDKWIVQTGNTKQLLSSSLREPEDKIIVCPFFNENQFPHTKEPMSKGRNDYSYVAKYIPEKNHLMLIEAWRVLAKEGIYPTLHITIENYPGSVERLLQLAHSEGCKIINHGFCGSDEVKHIYRNSKAVVYSSMNESFGLGMIEAINMGCDVIGPYLPYVTSICEPSERFEYNVESMAAAIHRYEKGDSPKTRGRVRNQIKEFIELLIN